MKPDWQSDDGRIQLYCGDCLEIIPKLSDNSCDLIFADPPYGHNNNNGDLIARWESALGQTAVSKTEWRPIPNDGAEANEIFRKSLPDWLRVLKAGSCCCCCCGGGGPDPQFARWSLWLDEIFAFKQMVVWDKGPIGMGWHYRRSYETILVGQKPRAACKWYDKTQKIENIIRPGYRGIKKIIPSKTDHPTAKPWQLAAHFISLHTLANDIVLDPFMGHASTGVACIRTKRRFIGIEIDKGYFEIAKKRIENELQQLCFDI